MESSLALLQGRWKALVLWHLTSFWIIFITGFFYDPARAFVMTIVVVVLMALIVFVLLHATNLDIKQHYGGEERLFCPFMIDRKY